MSCKSLLTSRQQIRHVDDHRSVCGRAPEKCGSAGKRTPGAESLYGGAEPLWIRGGRAIAYRTGDRRKTFVAVDVRTDPGFSVSAPAALFTADWEFGTLAHEFREWEMSPDGSETFGLRALRAEEPDRRIRIATASDGEQHISDR